MLQDDSCLAERKRSIISVSEKDSVRYWIIIMGVNWMIGGTNVHVGIFFSFAKGESPKQALSKKKNQSDILA